VEQLLVDNRYRIVKPLGAGGMAEVYLAHDDVLDRHVALKVMSERYAYDDEFVERFRREAQSAAALSHPNIVSIYDRGESEDGTYYIAMECLPGGTLKDHILRRGALPARTAAAVALQIAEALRAAHQSGVVHRDIKPHNVLVTAAGDVKVGDFGIARAATTSTMTRTGSILGTAHYISPEQAMGEPVGPQSDLYSLGVVLYEMLTGALPYDAETPIGIAVKHVNGYLVPPNQLNPDVPEGINAITVRLLEKNLADRYADAGELIEDLERVLGGLDPANAPTRVMDRLAPARKAQTHEMPAAPLEANGAKRRRRHWGPILFVLLLLALLAGLAYAFDPSRTAPEVVTVPDLVGARSVEEARAIAGAELEVAEGNRVEGREAVGTVVAQDPDAGETAEPGSRISVDVVGTQIVDLPDVEGETREKAVRILEGADFEVEEETEQSSEGNEGYVTEQDPRGGEGATAEAGSTVTITVGAGPAPVSVPDLYNRTLDGARQALEGAGLALGSQTTASSDQVPAGRVVEQRPVAAAEAKPGSSVDVTVSSGPRRISVPDVVGLGVEEAKQTVYDAGFGYTVERVQSEQPEGTVVSTDPPGGTLVEPTSVTIRASLGPPPPAPLPTPVNVSTNKEEVKAREVVNAREEAKTKEEVKTKEEAKGKSTDRSDAKKSN
jgi:beta-lactam-binding protein with PASTA domain/tRNA A-37 threonylcarbamoyl transferase component Bud32